jgi:hypothetical protein
VACRSMWGWTWNPSFAASPALSTMRAIMSGDCGPPREDARRTAGQMNDPQAKRMILGVAVGYEKLAKHTAALAESGLPMDKREAEPDNE